MWQYLLRRLLFFVPTFLVITFISYFISTSPPTDPAEDLLNKKMGDDISLSQNDKLYESEYMKLNRKMNLHLPRFYFSITPLSVPDTLNRIPHKRIKQALRSLIHQYGNWPLISEYYKSLISLKKQINVSSKSREAYEAMTEAQFICNEIPALFKETEIEARFKRLDTLQLNFPTAFSPLSYQIYKTQSNYLKVRKNATSWKNYIPSFHFHGLKNQYHQWLKKIIRLDFGKSSNEEKVLTRIRKSLGWSIFINVASIFLAYFISIPIGVYIAKHHDTLKDRLITIALFTLYALPSFWVATMAITFLCNQEYLAIFPSGQGMSDMNSPDWPFWQRVTDYAYHLILPTLCFTYGSFAYLSQHMKSSMVHALDADYILTARAKGLSEQKVTWKHAFRNALIPIITTLAGIFPRLIGGSIIIETIFSIPGVGWLTINAYGEQDVNLIMGIFTLGAILVMIGMFVSDLLLTLADPRISFTKQK